MTATPPFSLTNKNPSVRVSLPNWHAQKNMANDEKTINFEAQLAALEDIVARMEKGDLSLEESLKAYEKGIQLTRECQTALDNAQQRIDMLVERDGKLLEEPFEKDS